MTELLENTPLYFCAGPKARIKLEDDELATDLLELYVETLKWDDYDHWDYKDDFKSLILPILLSADSAGSIERASPTPDHFEGILECSLWYRGARIFIEQFGKISKQDQALLKRMVIASPDVVIQMGEFPPGYFLMRLAPSDGFLRHLMKESEENPKLVRNVDFLTAVFANGGEEFFWSLYRETKPNQLRDIKEALALIGTKEAAEALLVEALREENNYPNTAAKFLSSEIGNHITWGRGEHYDQITELFKPQHIIAAVVLWDRIRPMVDSSPELASDQLLFAIGPEGNELLIERLWKSRDGRLANKLIGCGDRQLEREAKAWAIARGYVITFIPNPGGPQNWKRYR